MALFGKKKEEKEVKEHSAPAAPAPASRASSKTFKKDAGRIIFAPRITEKGAYIAEQGVYVFDIAPSASKTEVAEAIRAVYDVVPVKVNVVRIPAKRVAIRGTRRMGKTASGKKAYVYLKKGDKIDIA